MSVIIALCNTGNVNYNHNIRVKQGIENTYRHFMWLYIQNTFQSNIDL